MNRLALFSGWRRGKKLRKTELTQEEQDDLYYEALAVFQPDHAVQYVRGVLAGAKWKREGSPDHWEEYLFPRE